jgi:hypothetical protein
MISLKEGYCRTYVAHDVKVRRNLNVCLAKPYQLLCDRYICKENRETHPLCYELFKLNV